jgi:hypothetical protein
MHCRLLFNTLSDQEKLVESQANGPILYLIIEEEAFPWFGPLLYALVHRKVRLRSLGFIWARVRI